MEMLIAGLLLWALVHLSPSVAPSIKQKLTGSIGENGYKGLFSLLLVAALVLIVMGWRSSIPQHVYMLPIWTRHAAMLLVLIALILFGASMYPTRIKRIVSHPQLSGVLLWAVAHLIINGDSRSLALFGGMGLWALLQMVLINRRDGKPVPPAAPGWGREIRGLIISLVIFLVLVFAHPWLAGVAVA